jgi:hypothetical protein
MCVDEKNEIFDGQSCRTNLVDHFIATIDMVIQFVTGCRHTPLSCGSICVGCGRLREAGRANVGVDLH